MANAANTQHEPTMEEILASIRKIISEDAPEQAAEAAAPAPPPPPAPMPEPVAEMDVLELTEEIPDEKQAAHAPPPELSDDVIFEPIEEPAMSNAHDDSHEGIFSDKTRAAMDNTFAHIDTAEEAPAPVRPSAPLPPVDNGSIAAVFEHAIRQSFEPVLREWLGANSDAVVAHMTPVIREWMDENFPPLLEDAVRSEVARAVRAKSKR
jgi:cell pole-organizing protein PopZ